MSYRVYYEFKEIQLSSPSFKIPFICLLFVQKLEIGIIFKGGNATDSVINCWA